MSFQDRVHIVETIMAAPDKIDSLKEELLKLVPLSRQEKGCLYYDLYQHHQFPDRFTVITGWQSRQDYDNHTNAAFIQEFVGRLDKVLYEEVIEDFYQQISIPAK